MDAKMPKLTDPLHLNMLESYQRDESNRVDFYGLQWGDPNAAPALQFVRDQYIAPYVRFDRKAIEIGPGGGRWTRYLLGFERLYLVDYHQELLDELAKTFRVPNMVPVKNSGSNFPGIPENSIDFVFSFGVFVHLDLEIIRAYLRALWPIVKNEANIVLQYSDKTKSAGQRNRTFSENTPDTMRLAVSDAGYTILEENVTILPHSSIMRFRKGAVPAGF